MNNYEQMRDVIKEVFDLLMLHGDGKTHCILSWDEFNNLQKKCRAVLALPPRQCDVGTPYEQANRMRQFCAKQKRDGMRSCAYCPIAKPFTLDCALIWGQRTYKKGGEE